MDPYLLDLRRFIKDLLISNNTIKANVFIIKFFFKTGIINFNNIAIEVIINQQVFNISFNILIIKKLVN